MAYFKAQLSLNTIVAPVGDSLIPFDFVEFESHPGSFNTATHEWTVPSGEDGVYCISVRQSAKSLAAGDCVAAEIFLNGTLSSNLLDQDVQGYSNNANTSSHAFVTKQLVGGDVVRAHIFNGSPSGKTLARNPFHSHFEAFKVA